MKPLKDFVELIPKGQKNAISVKELSELTGLDTRSVRAVVSRIRRQNVIVCSNSDSSKGKTGFFLPENDAEIEDYVRNERRKLRTYHAAVRPAEKYLKERETPQK